MQTTHTKELQASVVIDLLFMVFSDSRILKDIHAIHDNILTRNPDTIIQLSNENPRPLITFNSLYNSFKELCDMLGCTFGQDAYLEKVDEIDAQLLTKSTSLKEKAKQSKLQHLKNKCEEFEVLMNDKRDILEGLVLAEDLLKIDHYETKRLDAILNQRKDERIFLSRKYVSLIKSHFATEETDDEKKRADDEKLKENQVLFQKDDFMKDMFNKFFQEQDEKKRTNSGVSAESVTSEEMKEASTSETPKKEVSVSGTPKDSDENIFTKDIPKEELFPILNFYGTTCHYGKHCLDFMIQCLDLKKARILYKVLFRDLSKAIGLKVDSTEVESPDYSLAQLYHEFCQDVGDENFTTYEEYKSSTADLAGNTYILGLLDGLIHARKHLLILADLHVNFKELDKLQKQEADGDIEIFYLFLHLFQKEDLPEAIQVLIDCQVKKYFV